VTPSPNPHPLLRSYLFAIARDCGARMTAFNGWEMPLQFEGIMEEHRAVRESAGVFDISHMGKFVFKGKTLVEQFQTLVPSDLSRLQAGEGQYTVLLEEEGGIIDDFIFYYQGEDVSGQQRGVAIVNAGNRNRDKAWLLEHLKTSAVPTADTVAFQDRTQSKILMAIQGPKAIEFLQPFVRADLNDVPRFGHIETTTLGQPGFFARTGYTGEDGFEIMVDQPIGKVLWQSLVDAGVMPCGLGARDTLRLEAGLALHGQDIDRTTTPIEAGLKWLVHKGKGDYIGKSVLDAQRRNGVERKLVGLKMDDRRIARHGYPVLVDGKAIGEITSGGPSPTLGYPIALAYVPPEFAKSGTALQVEIRGKVYGATVVKKPFYRRSS